MDDVFTIIGMPREKLLDEARQFSEHVKVFDLSEVVSRLRDHAPGCAGMTFQESDANVVTSALRLAPKLAMALMAMDLVIRKLNEDLARLKEQTTHPQTASAFPAELPSSDDKQPADKLLRLRSVIENLVLNAEFAWEQGAEARDWKEAIAEAREVLLSDNSK